MGISDLAGSAFALRLRIDQAQTQVAYGHVEETWALTLLRELASEAAGFLSEMEAGEVGAPCPACGVEIDPDRSES